MAATRKPRVPLQEQIRLINECRKSRCCKMWLTRFHSLLMGIQEHIIPKRMLSMIEIFNSVDTEVC